MRDINSMSMENTLALNRLNSKPWQLGLPDKGHAIKGLVVCNDWELELFNLPMVFLWVVINRPLMYESYRIDCPCYLPYIYLC